MKTMIISFVVLLVALQLDAMPGDRFRRSAPGQHANACLICSTTFEFNPADPRTIEEQRAEFRRSQAQSTLCCCVSNPSEPGHNRASGVRVNSGQPNRLAEWLEYLLCCVGRGPHGHRD